MNTRLLRLFSVVAVAATCIISCGKQEKPDDHSTPDSGSGDKKVTGVTLDKTSVTLSKGQEIQLKATVKPDDAENKTVLWTSSNKSVATVKDGLVTAVGDGTSVIKVTTVDGLLTATCDVEVSTIYVKKITIPESEVSLIIGAEYQIEPTITPTDAANAAIGYKIDKPEVASVDKDGLVKGLAVGTAKVTVYALDGAGASATLSVRVQEKEIPVEGVSISPSDDQTIKTGETLTLKAVFKPADATNRKVTWSSGDTGIATVSEKGVVTGKSRGTAVISVKTEDGGFEASVNVRVVQAFSAISITSPSTSSSEYDAESGEYRFCVGDSFTLGVATEPAEADDEYEFYVESSSQDYISVDASGKFTLKKSNSSKRYVGVRSKANPDVNARLAVSIYDKPDKIELSVYESNVFRGYPTTDRSRASEYIGIGCTQTFKMTLSSSTGSRLLPGKVEKRSVSTIMFDVAIDGNELKVTCPVTQTASTSTRNREGYITLGMPGGNTQRFTFKASVYDPYQPKPGDGIWSMKDHHLFEYSVVDSGYRGNGVYENPIYGGVKSQVYAIIAWLGNDHLTEDPQYKKSGATGLEPVSKGYHGIAVPVNADRLYNVTKASGEQFSGEDDNLLNSSDIPKWLSDKKVLASSSRAHTAYTNTAALIYRNAPCGASHEVYPANFFSNTPALIKISQDAGESHKDFSKGKYYFYGSFKEGGTGCTFNAKQVDNGSDSHTVFTSPWLFPTLADFYSIFLGTVPSTLVATTSASADKAVIKEKVAVLVHSAKAFSGQTLTFSGYNWWASQQVDAEKAPQVNISADGTMTVKSEDKFGSSGYVLPICYF